MYAHASRGPADIPRGGPRRQLGQLAVVVGRQVVADLAELLVDDREVVDEPLCSRRDRSFVLDGAGQEAIRLHQDPAVLGDPWPDRLPSPVLGADLLRLGKRPGVFLQALDAEELGEDRFAQLGAASVPIYDRGPVDLGWAGWVSSRRLQDTTCRLRSGSRTPVSASESSVGRRPTLAAPPTARSPRRSPARGGRVGSRGTMARPAMIRAARRPG